MTPGRKAYCGWMRVIAILWPLALAVMVLLAQGPGVEAEAVNTPPGPQSSAEHLIAEHHCSVFGYGRDLIPGHAVVDTGTGPRYTSADPAFEIYEGKRQGTIYAWCV